MYTRRLFDGSDADYAGVVAVDRAVWSDSDATVETMRHYDEARVRRYLVTGGGSS